MDKITLCENKSNSMLLFSVFCSCFTNLDFLFLSFEYRFSQKIARINIFNNNIFIRYYTKKFSTTRSDQGLLLIKDTKNTYLRNKRLLAPFSSRAKSVF